MILIADEIKLKQDALAYTVARMLEDSFKDEESFLYYYFPLYRGETVDDIVSAQLLFTSPKHGVFYIKCLEEDRYLTENEIADLESLDSHLFDRFLKRAELRSRRREIIFDIKGLIFGKRSEEKDEFFYVTSNTLISTIRECPADISKENYRLLTSCIEGTTKMISRKERVITQVKEDGAKTKGEILNIIQNHEAALDIDQKQCALMTIDGPQRIRGLAGSGKTIMLTMKAALYHLQHPDEEIVYTYSTKNLKGLIQTLIEKFYRDNSDNQEPNWKKIHILHAWGGQGLAGLYSKTCSEIGEMPIDLATARYYGRGMEPFSYVCKQLLDTGKVRPTYDLTIIDEGQDFKKEFYQLCFALSKDKRIVWAYDEFQDIFNVNIQDVEELFGNDATGRPNVSFKEHRHPYEDIVLKKCYRNPRLILIAAFTLGLGIYNDKVLQRLPSNQHWESLGFTVESGNCEIDGSTMVISRSTENTPSISNEEFGLNSIKYKIFDTISDECRKVAKLIIQDIRQEHLRPDDICVVCLDMRNMTTYYQYLQCFLEQEGIQVFNMLNAPNSNTRFFYENCVTLSTINKAKGNEAGMVYLVGADSVFNNPDNIQERNKLFTSMTRAKGWLTITGGKALKRVEVELGKLTENKLKLVFNQPSEESTNTVMKGAMLQETELGYIEKSISKLEKVGMSREAILRALTAKK